MGNKEREKKTDAWNLKKKRTRAEWFVHILNAEVEKKLY